MKLSQFKFKLPEEQVALEPTFHRDECRLMVVHRKSGTIEMTKKDENGEDLKDDEGNPVYLDFRNILDYFDEDDTFIFNDTQVFPARLYGTKEKTDAKIEVFLLRELNPDLRLWDVLVEPARKIRIGNKLFFEDDGPMVAEVIDNTTSRGRTLRFSTTAPTTSSSANSSPSAQPPCRDISSTAVLPTRTTWSISRPSTPRTREPSPLLPLVCISAVNS